MIKKFRFYLTYADIIGDFTDDEAGQFIKKMCRWTIRLRTGQAAF